MLCVVFSILVVFFRKILSIFGLMWVIGVGVVIVSGGGLGVFGGIGVGVGCVVGVLFRFSDGRFGGKFSVGNGFVVGVLFVIIGGSGCVLLCWFIIGLSWLLVLLKWNMCLVNVGWMFSMLIRKFSVFRLLVSCLKSLCGLGSVGLIFVLVSLLILLCICR